MKNICIWNPKEPICGADNWVEIENYGIAKQAWLETFLELGYF